MNSKKKNKITVRTLLQLVKLLCILLMTAVLLFWMNQGSLNKIWPVTYHKEAPWHAVENPLWDVGSLINSTLVATENHFFQAAETTFYEALKKARAKLNQVRANLAAINRAEKSKEAQFALNHLQKGALILKQSGKAYHTGADSFFEKYLNSKNPRYAADDNVFVAINQLREEKKKMAVAFANIKVAPLKLLSLGPGKIALNTDDVVFFAGDSMMQAIAPRVKSMLFKEHHIKSIDLSKQSSGLTYSTLIDWPKTIRETIAAHPDIKVLVVFLGPNDPWDMPPETPGKYLKFKSPEWEALYRKRIEGIMADASAHHVKVIWISPPNMRRKKLSKSMIFLRDIYQSEAKKADAYYLSVNDIFKYDGTHYSNYMGDGSNRHKLRTSDGTHFSFTGQKLIARAVMNLFAFPEAAESSDEDTHHEK